MRRLAHLISVAGVVAAGAVSGSTFGQTVEFRIVERQGQQAVVTPLGGTATTDAVLNFAVQARVVDGDLNVGVGNFQFNIHIVGEADGNGTLAKLLISNSDGTYAVNTQQAANASVGRGGMASLYTFLAGIAPDFNGLINVSSGTFTNGPDQELAKITGSPTGSAMLLRTDTDGDGNPDSYTGPLPAVNGATAPVDSVIAKLYMGANGRWIDVYRFRYTVTNLATPRTLHFVLDNQLGSVTAQIVSGWQLSNGVWGPIQTNAVVSLTELDVPVSDVGACCDSLTGQCAMVGGASCVSGRFAASGTCTPDPCSLPGVCCANDGSCTLAASWACGGAWTAGGTCQTVGCAAATPCCMPTGVCTLTAPAGCVGGTIPPGMTCTPNPCPQPGGCCGGAGACTVTLSNGCAGTFIGGSCTPNVCPLPGACCTSPFGCTVTVPTGCATTFVPNQTCTPSPCPVFGACCATSRTCTLTTPSACGSVFIAGVSCSTSVCPVFGACCQRNACSVQTRTACESAHGLYQGDVAVCLPAGASNACCVGNFDGMNGLQVADIFAFLSAWFAGDLRADADTSGVLTVLDIFAFIGQWRDGGCR